MPKSTNYSPAATPLASSNLNPVACGTPSPSRPRLHSRRIAILALSPRPYPSKALPAANMGPRMLNTITPSSNPSYKNLHGIIVYQEQIPSRPTTRRFLLTRRHTAPRHGQETRSDGCSTRKIYSRLQNPSNQAELAGTIFDNIEKFAQYGFNKSHSTAYGLTYQTAWLKAHYQRIYGRPPFRRNE